MKTGIMRGTVDGKPYELEIDEKTNRYILPPANWEPDPPTKSYSEQVRDETSAIFAELYEAVRRGTHKPNGEPIR